MAKKPSIAVRLERAASLSLFAVHGLSGARRLSACAKKSPAFAGLIVFKYDPVASLSAPAGRGQKFVAEKSPLLRLGVSRLHGLNVSFRLERWGYPRPNLKAGVCIHAIQSSRTASKWCGRRYPCPRRCSEFLPLSSKPRHVCASRITRKAENRSSGLKQTRCQ